MPILRFTKNTRIFRLHTRCSGIIADFSVIWYVKIIYSMKKCGMSDFTFQLILSSHFRHLLSLSNYILINAFYKKNLKCEKNCYRHFYLFFPRTMVMYGQIRSGIMAIQNSILPKNNMVPVGFYFIFCIH